jgi:hypothetical protein
MTDQELRELVLKHPAVQRIIDDIRDAFAGNDRIESLSTQVEELTILRPGDDHYQTRALMAEGREQYYRDRAHKAEAENARLTQRLAEGIAIEKATRNCRFERDELWSWATKMSALEREGGSQ